MSRAFRQILANADREAWLRFFLAVAGLLLAFGCAMLSTIARDSGRMVATTVFASLALLLAGLVGLTSVPYLARRVAVARMQDAFNYEVTKEGVIYLATALIIGIAALNTGNNLLFIILAAMLGAIVVSGFASAAVLYRLRLEISLPQTAFAGRPLIARVRLVNPRRWFPAFSVRIASQQQRRKKKTRRGWEWHKTEFVFPRKASKGWIRMPDYALRRSAPPAAPPLILPDAVYFPFVPAQTSSTVEVELRFPKRGLYSQNDFTVATRFPFSFVVKSRRVPLTREVLIYPALLESDRFFDMLPMITGEFASYQRGRGTELYRIREHTPQDSARFVDWKATAKTGALKVREFTREDERRLRIVFDNPAAGTVPEDAYEHAISTAASLACHFAGENVELAFAATAYQGAQELEDFLRYLALVRPGGPSRLLDDLPVSPDYNLVITASPRGSIPTDLWATSYVIFME